MNDQKPNQIVDVNAAIRELVTRFVARLPATVGQMREQLAALVQNSDNHTAWQTLHRHLHNLAGSGGTLGFTELGDEARQLEQRIAAQLKVNDGDPTSLIADLDQFLYRTAENFPAPNGSAD